MNKDAKPSQKRRISLETAHELSASDLLELCDATEEAITSGGGFGWLKTPPRNILENYWRGVLLIPERHLIIGKLDFVVAGSCQIVSPQKANEAQAFSCQLTNMFLAPWARGFGLAQKLVDEATDFAKSQGFSVINLDVRATQVRAITSFEACGFKKFGENPNYAYVDGAYVTGYYYSKEIR